MEFWFKPAHFVRLDIFQRCFSFTFLIYTFAWFFHAKEWLTPYGFHYTAKIKLWHMPDPFPLLPMEMLPYFGIFMFGSTLALILGWQTRKMVWLVLACAIYIQNVDFVSAYTLNKFYVVVYAILALAPRPRKFLSQDGKTPQHLHSVWPIRIIQATLLIQYISAGFCKALHGDWLTDPFVFWSQIQGIYCTDFAAWLLRTLPKTGWIVVMYAGFIFELFVPVLFVFKRTRLIALFWGLGFQVLIALTMHQLIYFSAQMLTFYILFFDENDLLFIKNKFKKNLPNQATYQV